MDELIIPRVDDFAALVDADAQTVRTTVLANLATDAARYLSEYSERFGNVLNADDAATLFGEYNADRARYRVAVHPAATWVRDELFRRCLAVAPADDGHIVFTAGCNAAGKTTVIRSSKVCRSAHAVFDSTLSNIGHARGLVARALAANWRITVLYIDVHSTRRCWECWSVRGLKGGWFALPRSSIPIAVRLKQFAPSGTISRMITESPFALFPTQFRAYEPARLSLPNHGTILKSGRIFMNCSEPSIAQEESRELSMTESVEQANEAHRRFADQLMNEAIEGLNRLAAEKAAAKNPRQAA